MRQWPSGGWDDVPAPFFFSREASRLRRQKKHDPPALPCQTSLLFWRNLVQLSDGEAERLVREGADALRQGRPRDARERFERVTRTGRANAQIWLLLASACHADNDLTGEEAAVDGLLALEPGLLRARLMKARCRASAGDERSALSFYETALLMASSQTVAADLVAELGRAENWVAEQRMLAARRREAALTALGHPRETRTPRFQKSVEILSHERRIFLQEPTGYYFPELPQIQFYDTALFDWVPAVEAATGSIRAELETLLRDRAGAFRPYLHHDANRPRADDNELLDNKKWSALFLAENGKILDENVARCPATWGAVQAAPLPRISNSPTIMFSLLRGGARIAPHTGTHNARLICHLPLIVPPGCGFRVGNETRQWEEGKLLIFDDTIEHEAWNESAEDRVILIFDIWRPELSEQERKEVTALFCGPALD
jgi:aspartyl/asparaginyl beta-hydroxylase (cupin superfamily)